VEYSQDAIKDALVIQEAPIDVYMIRKGKDKRQPLAFCLFL